MHEYRLKLKKKLRKPYLTIKSDYLKHRYKILSKGTNDKKKKVGYLYWLQSDLKNKDIYIDINKIEGYVGMRDHHDYEKHFVLEGDWDKNQVTLEEYKYEHPETSYRYTSMEDIFLYHKPVHDTEEYRHHLERIHKKGQSRGGMTSPEEVRDYFDQLHRLYESIQADGLLSQRQLGETVDAGIGCVLDRDGRLLKSHDGHHRYILAMLAGVKTIPVTLQGVSSYWMDNNITVSKGDAVLDQINRKFEELFPPVNVNAIHRSKEELENGGGNVEIINQQRKV